jgi:hypothetical protein
MASDKKRGRTASIPLSFKGGAGSHGDWKAAKQELSKTYLKPEPAGTTRAYAAISPRPEHNLIGVGIGEKVSNGKPAGLWSVKLFVRQKYPAGQIARREMLPSNVNGLPTDVHEVGSIRRFEAAPALPNPRTRLRPAQPGCSIGFADPGGTFTMAGTFGALVKRGGSLYVLSNNHVLADENSLPAGAAIYQPGLLDGGNANRDQIAALTEFVTISAAASNLVDCAIAEVQDKNQVTNQILGIGAPKGTAAAALDMIVEKYGRTTDYTVGRVTSLDTDIKIKYDMGAVLFVHQLLIEAIGSQPFSQPGDSGSLIVDRASGNAVGLLFAGSDQATIANPIATVLGAFPGGAVSLA